MFRSVHSNFECEAKLIFSFASRFFAIPKYQPVTMNIKVCL